MSSFIKDLARVGLSNVFIIAVGLITSIITARYVGVEGNGTVAALTIYPSLFMTLGSLGIRQSTTYYLGKGIYTEAAIKRAIVQIWMMTSVVSVVVCLLLMRYFSNSGDNDLWVMLALLPIPFSFFNTYNSGIFLGKSDIRTFNRINWLPNFVIMVATALLVIVLDLSITGVMTAAILGPLIMSVVVLFKNDFLSAFSFRFDWSVIKSMLSLGLIYALSLLVINLNYKADVVLLDKLSTPYELGIYSKGAGITQYLWQIPMLLSTIVFSRSATSKNDQQFSFKVTQLLRISFIIIGLVSLVLLFLSDFIIVTLYGADFAGSGIVLKLLLPGVVILTIFKVMNMDLAGKGKPWIAMKAMLPSLVLNVVLNLMWIPGYGASGSAFASTVSYALSGILFLYFYSVETGIPVREILKFRRTDLDPIVGIARKILRKP